MVTSDATIELATEAVSCCTPELAPRVSTEAAKEFGAAVELISHPIRLQILDMLAQHSSEVCVCDLEGALPVKQPTVSHHLRLLREAGLIDCVKRGTWAYYFLKRDALMALRARVLAQLDGLVR